MKNKGTEKKSMSFPSYYRYFSNVLLLMVLLGRSVASNPAEEVCRHFNEKALWTWDKGSTRAYFCGGGLKETPTQYKGQLLSKTLVAYGVFKHLEDKAKPLDMGGEEVEEEDEAFLQQEPHTGFMPIDLQAVLEVSKDDNKFIPKRDCIKDTAAIFIHLRRSPLGSPFYRLCGVWGTKLYFQHIIGMFKDHPYTLTLHLDSKESATLPLKEMGGRMQGASRFKRGIGVRKGLKRLIFGNAVASHVIMYHPVETSNVGTVNEIFQKMSIQFHNVNPSTYIKGMFRGSNMMPWYLKFWTPIVQQEKTRFLLDDLGLQGRFEFRCDLTRTTQRRPRSANTPVVHVNSNGGVSIHRP